MKFKDNNIPFLFHQGVYYHIFMVIKWRLLPYEFFYFPETSKFLILLAGLSLQSKNFGSDFLNITLFIFFLDGKDKNSFSFIIFSY